MNTSPYGEFAEDSWLLYFVGNCKLHRAIIKELMRAVVKDSKDSFTQARATVIKRGRSRRTGKSVVLKTTLALCLYYCGSLE